MKSQSGIDSIIYENYFASNDDCKKLLKFHNSAQLVLDPHISQGVKYNNIEGNVLDKVEEICQESRLVECSEEEEIILPPVKDESQASRKSAGIFEFTQITVKQLSEFLYRALGQRDEGQRRAYPSAGQLYPIEPLLWINNDTVLGLTAGIYHYQQVSHKLIPLYIHEGDFSFGKIIPGGLKIMGRPIMGIIYMLNVKRAVMKYRLRGYRNALIETGIMVQNVDRISNDFKWATRCWSSFDDRKINVLSGLHPNLFLPSMIQWIGRSENV